MRKKVPDTLNFATCKRGAFTLLELLVVIAIIALLLSVVMPALNKAKEQAKYLICKNSLHQYGLAGELYLNDFDETFPDPYHWLHNPDYLPSLACAWHDERNNYETHPDNAGWLWPYFSSKDLHVCPRFRDVAKRYGHLHNAHNSSIEIKPQYSYCMNGYLGTKDLSLGLGWYSVQPKRKGIRSPANIFFFCEENTFPINGVSIMSLNNNHLIGRLEPYEEANYDACFATFHKANWAELDFQSSGAANAPITGISNASFLDGHVDKVHALETFRFGWPK
jgi:prepilin-type N-terminal cleavage/methylation domain-containing protein/prepilin-type processing-associated H-X9-DG protein